MIESIVNGISDKIKEAIAGFFKGICLSVIEGSYWICLAVCIAALILYIAGQRKAGKYVSISFIIYFVLQSIKSVI